MEKDTRKEIADKIKIITSPDIVIDQSPSILLVAPDKFLKKNLENFIAEKKQPLNLYFYFGNENDIKWLLTISKLSDFIIIDIDNCTNNILNFVSYMLTIPNSYYKTKNDNNDWSLINKNRFYDFPDIKGL